MHMSETIRLHVRNSERGTLDRCPQQWWWGWREGLKPKETAKPLWFGTAIHEALADYYRPGTKRSKHYIDKFRESADMEAEYIRAHVGGLDEDEWVDARTLGETMLRGYVERYQGDKHWDVIATEQSFQVRIPFAGRHDTPSPLMELITTKYGEWFELDGTFDGVYWDKHDRMFKLMEHKTAASIFTGHLPMDNQAGAYWMVAQTVGRKAGWLPAKQNIKEITYNFLRKAIPDVRPRDAQGYATNKPLKSHYIHALDKAGVEVNPKATMEVLANYATAAGIVVLGDRSKVQPAALFERHPVKRTPKQRQMQLMRLQQEVRLMIAYREGWMEVGKHPSRDCSWCPFREMCELHEAQSDWEMYRDVMYRSQDPYADHRKSASAA
jgi:PD-(D/E)XK nuclease superfamily